MSQSDRTHFKVTLDLDIIVDDDEGLVPDVVVRDIGVTERISDGTDYRAPGEGEVGG